MRLLLWAPRPLFAVPLILIACDFDSTPAPRVEVPIVVGAAEPRSFQNDLGDTIEIERCRVVLRDLEFTTAGEMHVRRSTRPSLYDVFIPSAFAHPGHAAGGEIVGELVGTFTFNWWNDGESLGLATMSTADYEGANFYFAQGKEEDGLTAGDPLLGRTFDIAGTATRGERTVRFEVQIAEDEDRRIIGLPLDLEVDVDTEVELAVVFNPVDPIEGETVFDGIDLFADDVTTEDGLVILEPESKPYNLLRRALQTHDYYEIRIR